MLALLHDDGEPVIITVRRDLDPPVDGRREEAFNRYFLTHRTAAKYAQEKSQEGYDVYIKHGRIERLPTRGEKLDCRVHNIRGSRGFMLDLDVGPGKPYNSLAQAKHDIASLIKNKSIIRPSLLLATGHGLHVVWSLSELIDKGEWHVLKHLLYLKARTLGLKPDPGAEPIDRGVRWCGDGFANFKAGGIIPTEVLIEWPRVPVDDFRLDINPSQIKLVPGSNESKFSEKVHDPWDIPMDDVHWNPQDSVDHCVIMKRAREVGGASFSYPLFADLVSLCSKASDEDAGRSMAHELSYAHEGYSPEYVDEKFDTFLPLRAHVLCGTLARHDNGMLCKTCAFRELVRSPAGIPGKLNRQAFVRTEALADSRYYNSDIGLMRRKQGDEEKDVLVWQGYHVSDITLSEEFMPPACVLAFTAKTIRGMGRPVRLDMLSIPGGREFATAMARQGLNINSSKELYPAMVAWITAIRDRGAAARNFHRLGWVKSEPNAPMGFVLGNLYYAANTSPVPFQPDPIMEDFKPYGQAALQQASILDIMNNEGRGEVHCHLASALAAPLVRLTGAGGGGVMNYYSAQSGVGKTTISILAASLWGKPGAMMGGVDDTTNASMARLSAMNNLPFFFDEARSIDPKQFTQTMLFRTNHGSEKRRLNSASQMQASGSWATLNILTSNTSLGTSLYNLRHLGDAAAARYLELVYRPLSPGNASNIDIVSRATHNLENNYGHIGPRFAQFIVDNQLTIISQLDQLLRQLLPHTQLDPNDTAGRLHAMIGACIIIAGKIAIAEKMLPLDFALVVQAVGAAIKRATIARRSSRGALDPDVILDRFLRTMESNRVRTEAIGQQGATRALTMQHPPVRTPIVYEINQTTREIIVDLNMFGEAVAEEGQQAEAILRTLQRKYGVTQRIIGYGTPYSSGLRAVLTLGAVPPWDGYFN